MTDRSAQLFCVEKVNGVERSALGEVYNGAEFKVSAWQWKIPVFIEQENLNFLKRSYYVYHIIFIKLKI